MGGGYLVPLAAQFKIPSGFQSPTQHKRGSHSHSRSPARLTWPTQADAVDKDDWTNRAAGNKVNKGKSSTAGDRCRQCLLSMDGLCEGGNQEGALVLTTLVSIQLSKTTCAS